MIDYFENLYDDVFEYAYESLTDDIIWNGYYVESAPDGSGVILTEAKKSNMNIRKPVKKKKMSGSDIFKYARRALIGAGILIVLLRLIRGKMKKNKNTKNPSQTKSANVQSQQTTVNTSNETGSKRSYENEIALCDQLIERITSKKEKMEEVVSKAKKKKGRKKASLANTINDLDQTEEYKNILKSGEDIKTVGLDIMKMAEKYNVPVDSRLSAILNSL